MVCLIFEKDVYFSSYAWLIRNKKKKDEQIKNYIYCFSNLLKVSGTFKVDFTLEKQREVVCMFFIAPLLCFSGR